MLTEDEVKKLAISYLLKNKVPIVVDMGYVEFPDKDDPEEFLNENNLALVSFRSRYYDDPNEEHPCDPGIYIVYVNLVTGEVHMPPHM